LGEKGRMLACNLGASQYSNSTKRLKPALNSRLRRNVFSSNYISRSNGHKLTGVLGKFYHSVPRQSLVLLC
jgi:hypothetical protein